MEFKKKELNGEYKKLKINNLLLICAHLTKFCVRGHTSGQVVYGSGSSRSELNWLTGSGSVIQINGSKTKT
jgi:hypothetical protein